MKKYTGFIALAVLVALILTFALVFAGGSTTNAEIDFPGRSDYGYANGTITRGTCTIDPWRVVTANGIQLIGSEGTYNFDDARLTIKLQHNFMGENGLFGTAKNVGWKTAFIMNDGDTPNVTYLLHDGEYIVTVPNKWKDLEVIYGYTDESGMIWSSGMSISNWNAQHPDKAITDEYLRDWKEVNTWTMVLGTYPDTRLGTLNNEDVAQVFAARQAAIDKWNAKHPAQAFTGNCYPEIYALYGANGTEGGTTPTPTPTPTPSIPATGTAYPQKLAVEVDGKRVEFEAYYLLDAKGYPTNYVKVRDLAYVINGTKAQFAVEWNAAAGKADLVAGKSYTANGSENNTPFNDPRPYSLPQNATYVNGVPSDLVAFMLFDDRGGGYTYFQLRDLGRKLGFNVGWNTERAIAYIETDKPYVG